MIIKQKLGIITLTLLIIISSSFIVSADPPFTSVFTEGFTIESPADYYLKHNRPYTFSFHVYNQTTGLAINNASCTFHLYNNDGEHIFKDIQDQTTEFADYEFYVPESNFSYIGDYFYNIYCNKSISAGYQAVALKITSSGSNHTDIHYLIIFGSIMFVFLWMGLSMDNRRWIIKSALIFTALIISLLLITVGQSISFNMELDKMYTSLLIITVTSFSVFIAYIIINYFKEIVVSLKDAKRQKESFDDED